MARLKKKINNEIVRLPKQDLIELLVSASKWGSWAYTKGNRERNKVMRVSDFNNYREDELINLLSDFLKKLKDESNINN